MLHDQVYVTSHALGQSKRCTLLLLQLADACEAADSLQLSNRQLEDKVASHAAQLTDLKQQLHHSQQVGEDMQQQLATTAADMQQLQRKHGSEVDAHVASKAGMAERDREIFELRRAVAQAATSSEQQQKDHAAQVHTMQKDLIEREEKLTGKEFEVRQLRKEVSGLTGKLNDRVREVGLLNKVSGTWVLVHCCLLMHLLCSRSYECILLGMLFSQLTNKQPHSSCITWL